MRRKALQRLFLKFLQGRFYQKIIFPLMVFLENPFAKSLSEYSFNQFYQNLRHGDLVFTKSPTLFSYLIPGEWTHVGVYNANTKTIEEMLPYSGFSSTPLHVFFFDQLRLQFVM